MLLDKIKELQDVMKNVYDSMEQIHAMYLHHFPEYAEKIHVIEEQIAVKEQGIASAPKHDFYSGSKEMVVRKSIIDSIKGDTAVINNEEYVPVTEGEQKAYDDLQDKLKAVHSSTCRTMYRKITQLCHPDKCKRFSHSDNKRLRNMFDEAQTAYAERDKSRLDVIYISVCMIRGEPWRIDPQVMKQMETEHKLLLAELENAKRHKLYRTLYFHNHGYIFDAKLEFESFLKDHIVKLQEVLGSL